MSRKIFKITESKLVNMISQIILENRRHAYGHEDINGLYNDLSNDDDVHLSDNSDQLRGDIVTKKEYVQNMLKDAMRKKDWSIVNNAISYISVKM